MVSGFWGQNIGNAFFNIGGKKILEEIFGNYKIEFIQDQPGYRTFNDQSKGNPKNDVGLLKYLKTDFIVLQGPMLTINFRKLWEETFKELTKRGTKIILLGAAMFKHTDEEKKANREFLKLYKPFILSTRDPQTYEAFKDICEFTYNGLDSAFFVPDAYKPFELVTERPYITLNFDRWAEPNIFTSRNREDIPEKADKSFEYKGISWGLKHSRLQKFFSDLGKWQAYFGHELDFRNLPTEIEGYKIIRPEHRFNPHITRKIYRHKNAVASDEPFTYFTVYANTQLTLADRVHACVATLAYGKPAMLFTPSPRSRLFDRFECLSEIKNKPVQLDARVLEKEKADQIKFLKEAISTI
nr:polysaccharide pyruvyl transferase family protein [Pullulanibacillus pueri]